MEMTLTHARTRRTQRSRISALNAPAGYVDGGNLYLYEEASPTNNLDPSGLRPLEDVLPGQDGWSQWVAIVSSRTESESFERTDRHEFANDPPSFVSNGYCNVVEKGEGLERRRTIPKGGTIVTEIARIAPNRDPSIPAVPGIEDQFRTVLRQEITFDADTEVIEHTQWVVIRCPCESTHRRVEWVSRTELVSKAKQTIKTTSWTEYRSRSRR